MNLYLYPIVLGLGKGRIYRNYENKRLKIGKNPVGSVLSESSFTAGAINCPCTQILWDTHPGQCPHDRPFYKQLSSRVNELQALLQKLMELVRGAVYKPVRQIRSTEIS